MKRQTGKLICFTGIDGSGKTTQARILVRELARAGLATEYVWSRGEVVWRKAFLNWGRTLLGYSPERDRAVGESRRKYQQKKGILFRVPPLRFLWFLASKVEHVWQIRSTVLPIVEAGRIAVCDRYLLDSTVDLAVSFNEKEAWLQSGLNRWFGRFVPKPDMIFLFDVPAEEVMRRKDDIPDQEYIEMRVPYYQALSKLPEVKCVDGTQAVEAISATVLRTAQVVVGLQRWRD